MESTLETCQIWGFDPIVEPFVHFSKAATLGNTLPINTLPIPSVVKSKRKKATCKVILVKGVRRDGTCNRPLFKTHTTCKFHIKTETEQIRCNVKLTTGHRKNQNCNRVAYPHTLCKMHQFLHDLIPYNPYVDSEFNLDPVTMTGGGISFSDYRFGDGPLGDGPLGDDPFRPLNGSSSTCDDSPSTSECNSGGNSRSEE